VEQLVLTLKQYGVLALIGLLGLALVVYGLWGQLVPPPATVEIIKTDNYATTEEIVVDVAGSVEKPGVYTLPKGSRIGDAVVLAGGFSALADRNWVAQTLNLASELKDAQKIYILGKEDTTPAQGKSSVASVQSAIVNINTASVAELDALPGIGAVRAQAIIDNRPYGELSELVTKAKVPQSVLDKIHDQLSVF
jgi:competence protein ComEA